jgi:tetratricopeptide (TPR) repeat protein
LLLLSPDDAAAARDAYRTALSHAEQALERAREAAVGRATSADAADDLAWALGSASWYLLLNDNPQKAGQYAKEALQLDPSQNWIKLNRAHALLLARDFESANALYADMIKGDPDIRRQMKDDFRKFEGIGLATPEMKRITERIDQ